MFFHRVKYSTDNFTTVADCVASSNTSSIIPGLTIDISYSTYKIRTVDSSGNYGEGVLVPEFMSNTSVRTSNTFIYMMLTSEWIKPATKTPPFITTTSFVGLSGPTTTTDVVNTNYTQVTYTWTSFSDPSGTTNDGINCQIQKFNNVAYSIC